MPTNPELRKFIVDHFDHADLDLLIADYFVAYRAKEIPGLGLEKRAQNLIDYCGKTDQMANLEAALQTKHPKLYKAAFGALEITPVRRLGRDPQKCFISHASKDAEFAQQLGHDLRGAGSPVWIAPDSIEPGEIWTRAIERGLKECGVFVCCLTPNALESEWVKSETEIAVALAKSGEMRIFVLMVEACKASELSIWLTSYQHIQFVDRYAAGLNELKRALGLTTIAGRQPKDDASRSFPASEGGTHLTPPVVILQPARNTVLIDNRPIVELDPIGYSILEKLIDAAGSPISPRELLEVVLSIPPNIGPYRGAPDTRWTLALASLMNRVNLPDRQYISVDVDGCFRFG